MSRAGMAEARAVDQLPKGQLSVDAERLYHGLVATARALTILIVFSGHRSHLTSSSRESYKGVLHYHGCDPGKQRPVETNLETPHSRMQWRSLL